MKYLYFQKEHIPEYSYIAFADTKPAKFGPGHLRQHNPKKLLKKNMSKVMLFYVFG